MTTDSSERVAIPSWVPELFEKRIAFLREIADDFDCDEYEDGGLAKWAANLREIANWHETELDNLRGPAGAPVVTNSDTANAQITDDDGFPIINEDTYNKWMDEALQHLPTAEALAELLVKLRWHRELELQGIEYDEAPKGLTSCERSIYCILEFLKNNIFTQEYGGSIALARLYAAFVDIADGKSPTLFKPNLKKRRGGRPGKDVIYETIKGLAARALSELIEAGDKADEAANRVAKALRKSRSDMRDMKGETITNWRERIMQGEGPGASHLAVSHFNEPLPAAFGDAPKARGEYLLMQLEKRAAFFG